MIHTPNNCCLNCQGYDSARPEGYFCHSPLRCDCHQIKPVDIIRAAAIAVNPEIEKEYYGYFDKFGVLDWGDYGIRPIRLTDVLLALSKTGYANALLTMMIHKDGAFGILDIVWDLRADLDGQSETTKISLAELLK